MPRAPGLGATSTTTELLQTGAIPGREGVPSAVRKHRFGARQRDGIGIQTVVLLRFTGFMRRECGLEGVQHFV